MQTPRIILASKSPRRRDILQNLGVDFICEATEVDETLDGEYAPCDAVCLISQKKACACLENHKGEDVLIISADTIVVFDGKIIGKPKDEKDAFDILSRLSGNTHKVYTGYTVCTNQKSHTCFEVTDVTFNVLSDEQIRAYIATGEPMDKAGAYGIQQKGCLFVDKISGNYQNVVGFPASKICLAIKKLFDVNLLY